MSKKQSRTTRSNSAEAGPNETAGWHEAWYRQSLVRQHVIAFIFLLLAAVLFYAPIIFSGKQVVAGDTINWRGMAQSMIEYEEETGETALWAGRTFAGMPGYMISPETTIPQVDLVVRELRKVFWPTSNLMLMLLGMYFLAWYVTKDSLAGIFGAIAFGLSTYMPVILVAGHNSKFIALAWAPWMMLAFVYAMQKRTIVSGLLFAIALAANLRAGHVQITYYVTLAAGIWWLVEGVTAFRTGSQKAFAQSTGVLFLGSVLGLMMIAEPYLSHAELAPFTTRGSATGGAEGGMTWDYAMAWSQGFSELLTLLISNTFGGSGSTYWGPKSFTGGPHHFGGLVIALGLLACFKLRDRITLALLISIGLFTAFSLGEHFSLLNRPMFEYFPLFSAFRVPETWLSVVAMLVALMAARGVAVLRQEAHEGASFWYQSSTRAFAGVLGFTLIFVLFGSSLLSFEKPFEKEELFAQIQSQYPEVTAEDPQVVSVINQEISTRKDARLEAFGPDARRVAFFLLIALGLLFLMVRSTLPYAVTAFGLSILLLVDLNGVGHRYLTEEVLSNEALVEDNVPEYGFDTFLKGQRAEAGGDGSFRVLSLEFGRDPSVNARPSFHYESMGGYSAAKLRVFQDYLDHVLFTEAGTGLNPAALNMTNIEYVVAGQGFPGFIPAYSDEQTGMVVSMNPNVLPRAFLIDRVKKVGSAQESWSYMQSAAFFPKEEAVVVGEEFDQIEDVSGPADSTGISTVQMLEYTAQNMTFEAYSNRDRMLVISEVYYKPGWKATVNGVETKIYQVNQMFRGIVVPSGDSNITMSFSPPAFTNGRWIAGIGTLIAYGLLLFYGYDYWRRRKMELAE